jgi:superfamily II DNA helicase RecQ
MVNAAFSKPLVIIRLPHDRPNLEYHAIACPNMQDMFDTCLRLVTKEAGKRGMIFCLTLNHVDILTKSGITGKVFHGEMTRAEKQKCLLEWKQEGGLLIGTSAAGSGIDIPDVKFTINMGSYSVKDVAQETGRGNRDGARGPSYILHCPELKPIIKDHAFWELVKQKCLRQGINVALNESWSPPCFALSGASLCSYCQG